MEGCLGCDLTEGRLELPGSRVYATKHWVVEPAVGPHLLGTLIVKPFRHCTGFWDLTDEETEELGPLLQRVGATIHAILKPDQVYICLWSHADWKPGHLHFFIQPSWNHLQQKHKQPGPFLQVEIFEANLQPPRGDIEEFAERARQIIQSL